MNIQEITTRLQLTLSPMQQATTAAFLENQRNLIVLSPTGSGKTLAYQLPLTQTIKPKLSAVQAIVLVPGRELAIQSYEVFQSLHTGIKAYACHGGRSAMEEHREIRKICPQVIFATPGRLLDHLNKQNIGNQSVRTLIIDEFDKCLQLGFQKEMNDIIQLLPDNIRKVFLSATEPEADDSVRFNTGDFRLLDFRQTVDQPSDRLQTFVVRSQNKDKLEALDTLLRDLNTHCSIVFLNYRDSVERTADFLSSRHYSVAAYHGSLDQKAREETLYMFANHSTNILVSTDLGSRGLDIQGVDNIIHYHLPETEDAYTHRIGRTARWNKSGRVFFLLGPDEQLPPYIQSAEEYHPTPTSVNPPLPLMETLYIGKGKKDKLSKGDILGFLCKIGKLSAKEIGRIDVYDYYSLVAVSREKAAMAIDNVAGKKIKGIKTIVTKKHSIIF